MLEILQYVLGNFWRWAGATVLLGVVVESLVRLGYYVARGIVEARKKDPPSVRERESE